MCQIDGCNKTPIAVSLTCGVLICAEHIPIRPRFRFLKGKKKYRQIYNNWRKRTARFPTYPESKELKNGEIVYV